jgi:hypothetical protein
MKPRNHPPIMAIVRTAAKPGYHPRPVTERYVPRDGEVIAWWQLAGKGWSGIRAAALAAGIASLDALKAGICVGWKAYEPSMFGGDSPCLSYSGTLHEAAALQMAKELGKPSIAETAHVHYSPVSDPLPPGREGAARRLARKLPDIVTTEVAQSVYRMFESMEDCAARRYHLHFWSWALRVRGVDGPVVSVGTARRVVVPYQTAIPAK